jgi:outer membrane lipoprotein
MCRRFSFVVSRRLVPAVAVFALAACAAPVFKDAAPAAISPAEVALQPARHQGAEVVWGGKILDVRNLADGTEIQVAAYPLDRAQRPDPAAPALGRFILLLPGFAEPLDYPSGRFVTVHGRIDGTRMRHIGDVDRAYPALRRDALHVWPVNFPRERGQVTVGFGFGSGIR